AGGTIIAKAPRIRTCRIRFKRDFDIVGGTPQSRNRVERALNARALPQPPRSAAEENRLDNGALGTLLPRDPFEFVHDGVDPAVFVDEAANMRIEVAIGT